MTSSKLASATIALLLSTSSNAALLTSTDQALFLASLSGNITTLDFESQAPGSQVNSGDTLNGITFDYSIGSPPLDMMVANDYLTTSGSNYLGLNDTGNENFFYAGDSFTMTFDTTQNSVGLYLVSSDVLFTNDFSISTSAGSVFNSDVNYFDVGDGGLAYYVGLTSDIGFTSAILQFDALAEGTFLYSVDDITYASAVPVPAAVWLFGSGLIGLTGMARRKTA